MKAGLNEHPCEAGGECGCEGDPGVHEGWVYAMREFNFDKDTDD